MNKTVRGLLIAVVIIAVAVSGFIVIGRQLAQATREQVVRSSTRYTVSRGDLTLSAVGSGKIVSSDVKTVVPDDSIKEVKVKVGDRVKKGTVLATVVNSKGDDVNYKSDYAGVITAIPTAAQTVSSLTSLKQSSSSGSFEISNDKKLQMDVQATEQDVYKLKVGQSASIYIDALGLTVKGTVSRISQSGNTSGDYSTYDVTVTFDKGNNNVYLGMTGSAKISIETKKNVVKIPTDALIEQNGKRYVLSSAWLSHIDKPQSDYYITVTTGFADTDNVEITGGLDAGKEILILSSSSTSLFSFGSRSTSSGSAQ